MTAAASAGRGEVTFHPGKLARADEAIKSAASGSVWFALVSDWFDAQIGCSGGGY